MSSAKWPPSMSLGGIFSSPASLSLNPWAHANKAYLSYCSSDAWVGDLDASAPGSGNFSFKGQAIIEAAIGDMSNRLGLSSTSQVLFGGCSAGARGALFSLDFVQPLLPPGAQLRGFFDSALWLDVPPLDSAEVTLQEQTQGVFGMLNVSARIPPACAAAYPGAAGWKCIYGAL
jgi:hypothetical protein